MKVVADPPRRETLVEVPQHVLDTLYRRIHDLEERLRGAERACDSWLDSWTNLVSAVGDLLQRVRDRPTGKRYATVLDLQNLLRKIESEESEDA